MIYVNAFVRYVALYTVNQFPQKGIFRFCVALLMLSATFVFFGSFIYQLGGVATSESGLAYLFFFMFTPLVLILSFVLYVYTVFVTYKVWFYSKST